MCPKERSTQRRKQNGAKLKRNDVLLQNRMTEPKSAAQIKNRNRKALCCRCSIIHSLSILPHQKRLQKRSILHKPQFRNSSRIPVAGITRAGKTTNWNIIYYFIYAPLSHQSVGQAKRLQMYRKMRE